MPFDRCTKNQPWPSRLEVGDTIWGVTKNQNRYFVMGSLVVTWFGEAEDAPDYITSETLFEDKRYAAGCPTDAATAYRAEEMDELAYAVLPNYKGGVELRELSNMELSGFFQEVDLEFVEEQLL
jgi:hypothetical protein